MPRDHRVSVGTAVFIFDTNSNVLLMERKGSHLPGHFSVPGGWLDFEDESPEAAACREVKEEVGLELDPKKLELITVTKEVHEHLGCASITLYYAVMLDSRPELTIQEPEKCAQLLWHPRWGDLPTPTYPGLNRALRLLRVHCWMCR